MTFSGRIINRKLTVHATLFLCPLRPPRFCGWIWKKRQLRGPPRAPGASPRTHYYKKNEGKSGRGRPSQRVWSSGIGLLSWASNIKLNFRYNSQYAKYFPCTLLSKNVFARRFITKAISSLRLIKRLLR